MNSFKQNVTSNAKKDDLIYRCVEIKTNPLQTNFEKDVSILPKNLAYVKKFIYYKLFPNLNQRIEELEKIKETPNYDGNIMTIKQQNFIKVQQVCALDSFNTHNIKHLKSYKICLGTLNGSIIIYDVESNRFILEKIFTPGKRIETLCSSTIRYFDIYISRIASTSRGDPNINIFSFNHSFSVLNIECCISLYSPVNLNQPDIPLSCLIHQMKFSSDTFYLAAGDYSGAIRLYRFYDIPQNIKEIVDQKIDPKKDLFNNQLAFGSKKDEKSVNPPNTKNDKKEEAVSPLYILINHYKLKEIQNFSVIKKEEVIIDVKDKKIPEKGKPQPNPQSISKNDKGKQQLPVHIIPTEPIYEIKAILEGTIDKTPVLSYPKNFQFFGFSQKKLINDEKSYNKTYFVTDGFYYSFYGAKSFKYVSLNSLINEKMKNSFRVFKSKANIISKTEESISISNPDSKKEKEFICFLKGKIEMQNTNILLNQPHLLSNISDKIKTLEEFSYDFIYPLSCLVVQKYFHYSNYLGIGLKEGSIIVYDTDQQSDKHLFKSLNFEVSHISIDEGFLIGGCIDGQIHIYDLVSGNVTYQCYHNPYQNYPILSTCSFFPLLSLVIDQSQKISVYNIKEKNKICKIHLRSEDENYKITNINSLLIDYNQEYIILIAEKDNSECINYSVIDLIKFQSKKNKDVIKEYLNTEPFNYNRRINSDIGCKNTYISVLKIKDLILKCYPQFGYHIKKGLSIKKLLILYDSCSLPMTDEMKVNVIGKMNLNNLTIGLSKVSLNKEKTNKKELLKSVKEKEESVRMNSTGSIENITSTIVETVSNKDNMVTSEIEKFGMEENKQIENTAESTGPNFQRFKTAKYLSCQKKDIFYEAFVGIKDRYKYKEQRMQKIKCRFEKISNELKLPLISPKNPSQRSSLK